MEREYCVWEYRGQEVHIVLEGVREYLENVGKGFLGSIVGDLV